MAEDAHGRAREGVERAVAAGHAVLAAGGDALAAVQAAVSCSRTTRSSTRAAARRSTSGVRAADASIMRGTDRAAGAVAALHGIRNPVRRRGPCSTRAGT